MPDPDLDAAYALETPEDNRKLYADWAQTYDDGFVRDMDYQLPLRVAEALRAQGPFLPSARALDVGVGTGLIGLALRDLGPTFDGIDISAQMLAVAGEKKVYDRLIEADLTQPLEIADGSYDVVVSAGTFTHGHVGPDAIDGLIRVARKGALFVLAVNDAHFTAKGFATKLEALAPKITELETSLVPIYGEGADPAHAQDMARLVIFRTL